MTTQGEAPAPEGVVPAGRIGGAIAGIGERAGAIAAAEPLPPDARVGHEEAAWGPREILAHAAEAVPFWHGELERILAGDPAAGPAPFGRTATDAARAAIIERDRTLPALVLIERLGRDGAALTARVRRLTAAELVRTGRHPTWGDLSVATMLERTLAGHLAAHVAQLDAILRD